MKVPINWIKEYTMINTSESELIEKIRSQLGEVESVEDLSKKYEGIFLAEIVEKKDHPNADKLGVYKVAFGEDTSTVVAGDKMLEVGDKVAYITPGTKVPFNTNAPKFDGVVRAVKLRGVESNGMLASGRELDLNNDHERVMIIETDLPLGTPISEVLDMDDTLIEIENKALTNRPDCFSIIGLAREISGIQMIPFTTPELVKKIFDRDSIKAETQLPLHIENDAEHLCKRYSAVSISNVEIKDSPLWLQAKLSKAGMRPINNVVDITNYIMLLTGQPLHAFDYDKLVNGDPTRKNGANIKIRTARNGEQITTLDGKTVKLYDTNLMICDSQNPIAVAGVMGGLSTEIDENSTNLVLESANFDMYNNRKTSMQLGIFTDAVTRFSKGQDPNLTEPAITESVRLIKELAGGEVVSFTDIYPDKEGLSKEKSITIDVKTLNERLGLKLENNDIETILNNVELTTSIKGDHLTVTTPTFRPDLKEDVDIFEEVGRLYGYNNIEVTLPFRELSPTNHNKLLDLKSKLRSIIANSNGTEILTYNFTSLESFTKNNLDPEMAYMLKNPLSPELKFMRTTLLPSLIEKSIKNLNQNHEDFVLFEINKSHNKNVLESNGLPAERENLSLVYVSSEDHASQQLGEIPYYWAKHYLDIIFDSLNIDSVELINPSKVNKELLPLWLADLLKMFDVNSVALMNYNTEVGDLFFGIIGEPSPQVRNNNKLPDFSAMFEMDITIPLQLHSTTSRYHEPSIYPPVIYDVCYVVDEDVPYQVLVNQISEYLSEISDLQSRIDPIDIYQSDRLKNKEMKYITVRITLNDRDKTLQKEESEDILNRVNEKVGRRLGASIKE